MTSKKQFKIALVLALIVAGAAIGYWFVNVRDAVDVSLLDKPVLQSASGDTVMNANKSFVLQGFAALDPALVVDKKKMAMVTQVEYYANDKLIQTLHTEPFYMNTNLLDNGQYTIRSTVRFNDESLQEQSMFSEVNNAKEAVDHSAMDHRAHSGQ